jgi:hypothetical protein
MPHHQLRAARVWRDTCSGSFAEPTSGACPRGATASGQRRHATTPGIAPEAGAGRALDVTEAGVKREESALCGAPVHLCQGGLEAERVWASRRGDMVAGDQEGGDRPMVFWASWSAGPQRRPWAGLDSFPASASFASTLALKLPRSGAWSIASFLSWMRFRIMLMQAAAGHAAVGPTPTGLRASDTGR